MQAAMPCTSQVEAPCILQVATPAVDTPTKRVKFPPWVHQAARKRDQNPSLNVIQPPGQGVPVQGREDILKGDLEMSVEQSKFALYKALQLHNRVTGTKMTYNDAFESFFVTGTLLAAMPRRPLRVGTDCSGMEVPILALKALGVPHVHVFSSDSDAAARATIQANFPPQTMYSDITTRTTPPLHRWISMSLDFLVSPFPQRGTKRRFRTQREEAPS